jgi:hypothetical protein
MRPLAAACALALLCGCGRNEPEELSLVMKNEAGEHLYSFALDTGSGWIHRRIFWKDRTYQEKVRIKRDFPLHLTCSTDSMGRIDHDLEWTVRPDQNGGRLEIIFLPKGREEITFHPVARMEPRSTPEGNIENARKWFDRIEPGMPAAQALKIMGQKPMEGRKCTCAKDFGHLDRPETVLLSVMIFDSEVVRIEITYAYGEREGELVAEKGISKEEWAKRPEK